MARPNPFPLLSRYALWLSDQIENLDAEQLAALKKECAEVTTTNCGWTTYGLRQIASQIADNEEAWRAQAASEEEQSA